MATWYESVEEGSQGKWPFKPQQVVKFGGRSLTGELLPNFCYIFFIIGVVTFIICFSLQDKYKEEVVKKWQRLQLRGGAHWRSSYLWQWRRKSTWTVRSMHCFSLTLWMRDTIPLTTVDCLFWRFALFDGVLDSREAMPPRWSSSSTSSSLTPRVSQMHLNYESM
jgi:hypothetical protein